jgi:hypothetical protein
MMEEQMDEPQVTLRDAIESAVEEHEPASAVEQDAAPADAQRDDAGRFAAPPQDEQPAPAPTKPRPSSWKKDYDEHWTKLDPSLQDYIAQREQEYAKGVSTYKQNWDQAAPLYEAMQPFMPLLQQNNIDPKQWISNLGNAHRMLAQGSDDEKLRMFAQLATDYGVPLGALTGQQSGIDPQFSQMAQKLGQMENRWTQFEQQREQQENAALQNDISAFSQKAPHFAQVRETMAGLLQSGVAQDLQSAYDKAIRLHDDIWQQQQAEQAKAAAEQNQQKVAQARAKAVSPRSSSPTGMTSGGNGKKSLRDMLSEQIDNQLVSRV